MTFQAHACGRGRTRVPLLPVLHRVEFETEADGELGRSRGEAPADGADIDAARRDDLRPHAECAQLRNSISGIGNRKLDRDRLAPGDAVERLAAPPERRPEAGDRLDGGDR